ncbi:MAG: aminoacyl-tRNA hydrolase [Candidatus Cryptobacteroides sp.]|nr:aminoacyl-tRNA hydrolase [Rikenellaceae bacterium]MDY5747261.1 aminoacyl-tRNA hydrolase [Candidatus Cryptobacteroides sp.]
MSEKSYLVVGLGNIGPEYATTRHNIGFMILDAWAQASNVVFSTERYGDLATIRLKGREFHLLKPSTYMNLSGNAVRYWFGKLDIPPENLVIICDDLNLPFGTVRMRKSGSDGGHNGLKNIEAMLQTRDYARIRVGVGHEFEQGAQIDFVLGQFDDAQAKQIPEIAERIISGLKTWSFIGIDKAMTQLNTKPKKAETTDNRNNKESE